MAQGPIVLLTDFTLSDPFVGQMKGVIAGIAPDANVIDLSHNVPPQNIRVAYLFLENSRKYFPPGSIFTVVVDPGVGTSRRAILLDFEGRYFIGPDNGVFTPMVEKLSEIKAVVIENPKYRMTEVSSTFQGRDLFSPAAAHLAIGAPFDSFGRKISHLVPMFLPKPDINEDYINGEVIHTDSFGNAWTNVSEKMLSMGGFLSKPERLIIRVLGTNITGISKTYHSGTQDGPIALINSFGLLEIAWPDKSASKMMKIFVGTKVTVSIR